MFNSSMLELDLGTNGDEIEGEGTDANSFRLFPLEREYKAGRDGDGVKDRRASIEKDNRILNCEGVVLPINE